MADDRVTSRSPERRPVLVSSTSSSNEPTSSGLSGSLQPFFLGRTCAPSNLLSLTVPVRLDILYVLINAARGAQCLPPPAPIHDGAQASFSTCHEPPAQCAVSCCHRSACCCVPGCASGQQQPSGAQQCGAAPGGYGGHRGPNGGVLEQQNYGRHWNSAAERNGGSSRSDYSQPHAAGGWKRAQPHTGWRGNQRGGGEGEHGNGGRWQEKRQDFDRAWGNRRQGAVESSSWNSGPQGWRRGGSSFGSSASSMKRNQEGNRWQSAQDAPEAKRCMFGAREWQKTQGTGDPATFVGKAVDAGPAKSAALEDGEDWEAEYESEPAVPAATEGAPHASHQDDKSDSCKVSDDAEGECVTSAHPPKPELSVSPLPRSDVKDQGASDGRGKECAADWSSKEDRFATYLKNLYSDVPEKSSSEGDADLTVGIAVDPLTLDEEEQSRENVAGSP
ncbi:uncharacterized protein LOC128418490 [Podarcis raffonei]|uniref:uncharacterized protein LOC128418490 n=1 Tax=Podarcis raffonei TaxID=65483 RepID=UPI0023291BD1|nr:uncharacterized protein LOC128418490 [Podarcis raffonei]XP_053254182.1 uncharacterized protein LOC128418490 [Podarcis raffonei]